MIWFRDAKTDFQRTPAQIQSGNLEMKLVGRGYGVSLSEDLFGEAVSEHGI